MPNLNIYEKLPEYIRMFDRMGLIEHLANVFQAPANRFQRVIDVSPDLFNPGVLALTRQDFLPFLGQFVGLGTRAGEYLGIGINPEWPPSHQALVIEEAFQYWLQKGTEPGVRKAIRLWLQWLEADSIDRCRIVLPMGKVRSDRATLWFDHYTSFDDPLYQVLEDKQQLISGDYSRYYTPNEEELHQPEWFWEYDSDFFQQMSDELTYQKAPRRLGDGSHLIDHAPWQHFWLERHFEWNKVNPDILKLNPHVLSAVARPVPFSWLKPNQSSDEEIIKLRIPYEGESIEQKCIYTLDGIGYGDAVTDRSGDFLTSAWPFPFLGEYTEYIDVIEITETGVWYPFDYFDLFGGVGYTLPSIKTITINEYEIGYWPAFDYFSPFGKADSTHETGLTRLIPVGGDFTVSGYDTPFGYVGEYTQDITVGTVYEIEGATGDYFTTFGSLNPVAALPYQNTWFVNYEQIVVFSSYKESAPVPAELVFSEIFYTPASVIEESILYESPAGEPFDLFFYIGADIVTEEIITFIPVDPIDMAFENQFYAPADSIESREEQVYPTINCNPGVKVFIEEYKSVDPAAIYDENQYVTWDVGLARYVWEDPIEIMTHLTPFDEGYPWYYFGTDTFEEICYRLSPIDVFTIDLDFQPIKVPSLVIQPYITNLVEIQLCNIFATWSYEILDKECGYPIVDFDVSDYSLLRNLHKAELWNAILHTKSKLLILRPKTIFWTNQRDATDLSQGKYIAGERGGVRSLSYSDDTPFLCVEFSSQPTKPDEIHSVALIFDNQLIEYRSPVVRPLSFVTMAGFRFVVQPVLEPVKYK